MKVFNVRNVHEALPAAIHYIYRYGFRRESRNGDVLVAPTPVTTCYQLPSEMCVLWPVRDINPFATLFEGLWMLAGRNDVDYVARFIAKMRDYSDDGMSMHGAYGHRWRTAFGFDQLIEIAHNLKKDNTCRRQVLQIWSPSTDLQNQEGKKDLPCNLIVAFQVNPYGALDMTVFNRSNDLVWGTYGADAVHFAMLLQYLARAVGVPPGRYWQVSNNWHAYVDTLEPLKELQAESALALDPFTTRIMPHSPYESGQVAAYNIMGNCTDGDVSAWDSDLFMFMSEEDQALGYKTSFFKKVCVPMIQAHNAFKNGEGLARKYDDALEHAKNIRASDWRMSCEQWLQKRREKFLNG